MHAMLTGDTGKANRIKKSGFKKHVNSGFANGTGGAAHHPGECDGLLVISNNQGLAVQRNGLPVKQLQCFAIVSLAHDNATIEAGKIKRMHRLAKFEHDVIGDIHQGMDTTHTAAAQPLSHPGPA